MLSVLIYILVVAAVAGVVYLLASAIFGRGEEMAPLPPSGTPTKLPSANLGGDDVRQVRFQQVVRGYKASEVDWVLERLAGEIDELRARIHAQHAPDTEPNKENPW